MAHISNSLKFYEKKDKSDYLTDGITANYPGILLKSGIEPSLLNDQHKTFDVKDFIIDQKSKYKNTYKRIFNPNLVVSPFAASQLVDDPTERCWIYIDEHDFIQGPFSSSEMDNWYNNKCFPMDLLIGLSDRERSIRLGDFILSTYPFNKTNQAK